MAAQAAQAAQAVQANALELLTKIKTTAMGLKAKIVGEEYISFEEAVTILCSELRYPEDKALRFVKRFDHNKDGKLSKTEFSQFKTRIEDTFDHNKDGRLSKTEFSQFKARIEDTLEFNSFHTSCIVNIHKVRLVPKFKEYDRDGNGYITLDEASYILQGPPFNFPQGKVVNLLRKFDKDSNGKLDIEEFADFYAEAKATNEEITQRFAKLDRDGNGVLSPEEVINVVMELMGFDEQRAISLIQMFDQNQDGNLDKTEFMQLWSNMFGS